MSVKDYRDQSYVPTEWEDQVVDKDSGDVLVEGTPVAETTLGNLETGVMLSHFDIGMLLAFANQLGTLNQKELDKIKNQRILQGSGTITNTISDNGYFRSSEPFKTISLEGYSQVNAPNYDVILTPKPTDESTGCVGKLIAYDKTRNGFKVKMTGSADSVSFLWTLINPNV
ncbi:signal transduction protein [Lentibacillus sp. N15]|uniref:signal transduction protein n=1 Tax=Lentibacillus songyuanensis TaxID=3136161 RepID=UPI0031BBB6FF